MTLNFDLKTKMQKLQHENISVVNMKIVSSLAETFTMHPDEHTSWLIESCNDFSLSKTLLFLVVMQSFLNSKNGKFFTLEIRFPLAPFLYYLLFETHSGAV